MGKLLSKNKTKNNNIRKEIINKQYNIYVIGSARVGKTTFIKKMFDNNTTNITYETTKNGKTFIINTQFIIKENNDNNNEIINYVNIKEFDMFILMYDITNPQTINYIENYLNKLHDLSINDLWTNYTRNQIDDVLDKKIFIVGNKLDLVKYNNKNERSEDHVMREIGLNIVGSQFIHSFVEISLIETDSFKDIVIEKFIELLSK